jgi:AhpD family alkylhydroperoxidase
MVRDDERKARAAETPVVEGLPDVPGIVAAMRLSPGLAVHLRGLADELLVKDWPGTTLSRSDRELLATAVSAANDCFYCMDSHGAFASELLRREKATGVDALVDRIKLGDAGGLGPKMAALLALARCVQRNPRSLTSGSHGRGHAARRPHRVRVLHVQPDGRRLASTDSCEHGRLPRARGRDRGVRLQ